MFVIRRIFRFLRLAIFIAQDLRQGYALNKTEDKILAQAERASVNIVGPDALKVCLFSLSSILYYSIMR